jgi:signal transduction histidine kinase
MKYSDISKEYEEVLSSKETLTKYLDMYPIRNMVMTIVVLNIFMGYFANVLSILLDIVIISMIGFIVSRFARVLLNYRAVFILAVYSMTLPIFVTLIYAIINTLTGFKIMYFNLMYELIGCVYIVAAIYMIKFDLIKQNEELEKIIMVENQIRKEKEEEENRKAEEELKRREEQKKKEKEKKENKEDEIDAGEPDGSEI